MGELREGIKVDRKAALPKTGGKACATLKRKKKTIRRVHPFVKNTPGEKI